MKKLFLIIGAPGSGKTTDAELIAENHKNITHYSTGDMFRAEVASGSQRGALIDTYISKGLIVPIDIAIETRSFEQMNELDKYLVDETEVELVNVIEVVVSPEVARDRVLGRARGADDNVEVFNNRMKVYIEPLKTIQEFYESKNLLAKIDGERTIKEIVDEMDTFIKSKI
jgi:adenylate kinase